VVVPSPVDSGGGYLRSRREIRPESHRLQAAFHPLDHWVAMATMQRPGEGSCMLLDASRSEWLSGRAACAGARGGGRRTGDEKHDEITVRDLLSKPAIRIAPSLLAADFSRLAEDIAVVERAGAEMLHLDIMDGHFVPNISFGVPVAASLRPCTRLFLDAHLMITDPLRYGGPFVEAGCDHVTFHVEVVDDPRAAADHIRHLGVTVGVCLNPSTPASAIREVVEHVDMVLVMSVWPGFGGQKFIPDVLPKVREISEMLGQHQRLEIDGGIGPRTIALAAEAGADTFVAGSAIFQSRDPAAAYRELERLAVEAAGRS
jgi:ribulose-phosphate 3-epimerase